MDIQLKDTMTLPSGKERSVFDTTIPGQSFTANPGIYPWDSPPLLNSSDEVVQFFSEKFDNESAATQLLTLLETDISVSTIVDSLLLAGFAEGLFNPDVAVLAAEDLILLITYLGKEAGLDPKIVDEQEGTVSDALQKIATLKESKKEFADYNAGIEPPTEEETTEEEALQKGLMAKKPKEVTQETEDGII